MRDQAGIGARRRRATLVDVARRAGVSTASASKVLRNAYGASDSMRARVQAAMRELDYRPHTPARGMRGRTFTVGLVFSDLDNPFFSLLTDGILSVIRAKSYELLLAPAGFTEATQKAGIEAAVAHQMDGLILVSTMIGKELEALAHDIPLVVIGNHSCSNSLDSVAADDEQAAELVVDHLVAQGHRRIAFVMNAEGRSDGTRPECHRLKGFLGAMDRHGLDSEASVIDVEWSYEGGRAAQRCLDSITPSPTAVHAGADTVAFGMMTELAESGRSVPDAYALAGHDNSRTARLGPVALTSIDQSGVEMGRLAAEMLLERIEGRIQARHEVLPPELVVRRSTIQPHVRSRGSSEPSK